MAETLTRTHSSSTVDLYARLDDNPAARKRQTNHYMRGGLELREPLDPIPFFCECDRADCFAIVWLTRPAFDALRIGGYDVRSELHAG